MNHQQDSDNQAAKPKGRGVQSRSKPKVKPTLDSHKFPAAREHPVEYNTWLNMKQRCYNPKNSAYHRYGGRGIEMSYKWMTSFKAFFDYVGPRPSDDHSIDRIDNNGDYKPGNVRWALKQTQMRNRDVSSTRQLPSGWWQARISYNGKLHILGLFEKERDAAELHRKVNDILLEVSLTTLTHTEHQNQLRKVLELLLTEADTFNDSGNAYKAVPVEFIKAAIEQIGASDE